MSPSPRSRERCGRDRDADLGLIDRIGYPEVCEAIQSAESVLARPVNPTVLTPEEWQRKAAEEGSFVRRIASQPRLFVIGSDDAL